jgi:hypothetical protein
MEARSLPEALELILEERGCSQNRLSRDLGKAQSWVSEVISGKQALGFAKMIKLLAGVGWEVVIRPKGEGSEPVKRREFHNKVIKVAAGTVAERAAGVAFVPSARVPPFQNHEYVTALADHVRQMRNEQGGTRLISMIQGHVARLDIAGILEGRDRKLQMAAAKLVSGHAFALYDADRLNHAEGVTKNALALARASQDAETQAFMYATLSQIATYAGAGDRGRNYVQEGLKVPGISEGSRAELYIRLMRSLAVLPGNEKAALTAFAGIHNLDERQAGLSGARLAGLINNFGITLSDLGKHQRAIQAFADAADRHAQLSPHFYAGALRGEIMSLLNAKMPDVAADRMLTLAHIMPLINSTRLQKEVGEILNVSAPWIKVPGMRDSREQLSASTPLNAQRSQAARSSRLAGQR